MNGSACPAQTEKPQKPQLPAPGWRRLPPRPDPFFPRPPQRRYQLELGQAHRMDRRVHVPRIRPRSLEPFPRFLQPAPRGIELGEGGERSDGADLLLLLLLPSSLPKRTVIRQPD